MKDDEPHDVRQFHVKDGRGRRKVAENGGRQPGKTEDDGGRWRTTGKRADDRTMEDGRGRWETAGDDKMLFVLVLCSYLSGEFRKRQNRTTQCCPPWSWPRTDGLPRCEHCFGGQMSERFGASRAMASHAVYQDLFVPRKWFPRLCDP